MVTSGVTSVFTRAHSSFATASLVISTVSALRNAVEVAAAFQKEYSASCAHCRRRALSSGETTSARMHASNWALSSRRVTTCCRGAKHASSTRPWLSSAWTFSTGRMAPGSTSTRLNAAAGGVAAAADIWRAGKCGDERKIGRRRLRNLATKVQASRPLPRARARRRPAPCAPSEPFPRLSHRAHGCVAAERAMRRVVGLPRYSACPTLSRRGD